MKELTIDAAFGDKIKKVVVSQPHRTAAAGLHLMMDNYYCGLLIKREGKWTAYLNDKSWYDFTTDDIQILGDLIDKSGTFEIF